MKTVAKMIGYALLTILVVMGWALAQVAGKRIGKEAGAALFHHDMTEDELVAGLQKIAESINKTLPTSEGFARFDQVVASGTTLTLIYSFPRDKALATISGPREAQLRAMLSEKTCMGMKDLLEANATIAYEYYDLAGDKLAEYAVTQANCES